MSCTGVKKNVYEFQDMSDVLHEISNTELISSLMKTINKNTDTNIVLLRNKEVLQWLLGDLSFLPEFEHKNKTKDIQTLKVLEDKWGQTIAKSHRPDLKLTGQWTTTFGQQICHELYTLLGKHVKNPVKKSGYLPDKEVDDAIIEVKTQTYNTTGTAGEKILGVPMKYSDIPDLYGKPLKILCIGCAEKECRDKYQLFSYEKCTPKRRMLLDTYKTMNIEYIAATDLLKRVLRQD